MRAHVLDAHGVILNTIEVAALNAIPGMTLIDADAHGGQIGDTWNGMAIVPYVAPLDPAAYAAACEAAIQKLMDDTARVHGYDDLRSTITYASSAVTKWKDEALNAIAWRDACWVKAQQIQTDTAAGNWPTTGAGQIPTVAQVLAAMPPANWPTA
jgi:hypothetical protein